MLSTYKFGIIAEYLAIILLKIKMYKIIAIRYRNHAGEIDIIALKSNVIIFVEVKARKTLNLDYDPVQYKQIKRLQNAASLFLAHHTKFQDKEVRFDLIIISGNNIPKHLKNVW
jgi:putative endonuclease